MSKCLVKWIYYMVYYKKEDVTFITNVLSYLFTVFTTLVFRLIIPALLTMMLSVRSTSVIGIVLFKVVNFSRWPITRFTLILTCATCLDMSISLFFPSWNAGMQSTALPIASSSSTKKPRSANTQSPWVRLSRKLDFKVISLSEAPSPACQKEANCASWSYAN